MANGRSPLPHPSPPSRADAGPSSRSSDAAAMPTAAWAPSPVAADPCADPCFTLQQLPRRLLNPLDRPGPPAAGAAVAAPLSFRAILPLAVTFFFLVGFFTIYLLRDLLEFLLSRWADGRGDLGDGGGAAAGRAAPEKTPGLDPATLDALPVTLYADAEVEGAGDCAVCLSEFAGDDAVRVLPACRHVFHRDCIDLWFASHSTCPVCRTDLENKPPEVTTGRPPEEGSGSDREVAGAAPSSRRQPGGDGP